jgi:hypothetical protein
MFGTISLSLGKKKAFAKRLLSSSHPDTIVWERTSFAKTFFHLSGERFSVPKMKEA